MQSFDDVLTKRTLNCLKRLEFFAIYKTINDDANFRVKGPFGRRLRLTLHKILQRIDTLACPPLPFPLISNTELIKTTRARKTLNAAKTSMQIPFQPKRGFTTDLH